MSRLTCTKPSPATCSTASRTVRSMPSWSIVLVPLVCRLRDVRRDVAVVDDIAPELREPVGEPCVPDRRRAHVDPTPAGAEVERRADDSDRVHLGEANWARLDFPAPGEVAQL